jgi:hypothetical protein
MRTIKKFLVVAFGATLLMAMAVGSASAGRLSLSERNIRVTFNNLELSAEGLTTDTCHVTLEGSFHSATFAKTRDLLLGYITRVATASCSTGTTILTATLPWHVRYTSFSGTLPNITLITGRVAGAAFAVGSFGFICLARADIEANFTRDTASGAITSVVVPTTRVPLTSGGGFGCPAETGSFRSAVEQPGSVSVLGATTRITVRLI